MTRTVRSLREPLVTTDGRVYTVRIRGRKREDGLWEGWIEFESADGPILLTARETTQPKLADLEYWATGLTLVYLEGALQRALAADNPMEVEPDVQETSAFEGEAVMDPFSVYSKGEERLRRQLGALNDRHLRGIIRAYRMASADDVDLKALSEAELVELIVAGVQAKLTA